MVAWLSLCVLLGPAAAHAQTEPAQTESANEPVETQPIAATDVPGAAERDVARIADLEANPALQAEIESIESALPAFRSDINARIRETRKVIAARASVYSLRSLERDWLALRRTPATWRRSLDLRARELDDKLMAVEQIEQRWKNTVDALRADAGTPPAIRDRANETLAAVQRAHRALEQARSQVLTLQDRVANYDSRVAAQIDAIRGARENAMSRLLNKDSPSMLALLRSLGATDLAEDLRDTFNTQRASLRAYLERRAETLLAHLAVFVALLAMLNYIARRVRQWVKQEPDLARSTKVFDLPVAMAVLLSLLLNPWIYPQAPRLWTAILSVVGLVPAVLILRHVVNPALFTALTGLAAFFLLDQLVDVMAAVSWASRILLLIEAIAGTALMLHVLRLRALPAGELADLPRFWRVVRIAYWAALALFASGLLANVLGYAELGSVLISTMLSSAYVAVFFYTLLRILDGIVLSALRLYPLAGLRMVQRHAQLLRHRILRVLQFIAWCAWVFEVLERLSLRAPLVDLARGILTARSNIGSLHISLGDVIACGLAIAAALLISRALRFSLEEEVYPHLQLPRGVPYALSRLLHYVIVLIGFIIAIAAAGVDLTRFTILVSAFGVGIGFGLQQIINNFVSGIILLFERPVQVGDEVGIANITGVIERIGIRASIVRLENGATVIVPNSGFITERITNRALANPERLIEIRVSVAYGIDPTAVTSLLRDIAGGHPAVSKSPPPEAVFSEFTEQGVKFILRAHVDDPLKLEQTKSELGLEVNRLFAAGKLRAPLDGVRALAGTEQS